MTVSNSILRPRTKGLAWWLAGAVVSLAAAAVLSFDTGIAHDELGRLESRIDALQRQASAAKKPVQRMSLEEEKKWAALRSEMAFPWQKLFKAIELSANPDIDLLEFEPDRQSASARLRGDARDVESMLRYIENLSTQGSVRKAVLISQEPHQRGKADATAFELRLYFH